MTVEPTSPAPLATQRFPGEFVYFDVKDKPFAGALTARLSKLASRRDASGRSNSCSRMVVFINGSFGIG